MSKTTVLRARGTTNRNARGSSHARRQRREWLVETYRANQDIALITFPDGSKSSIPVMRGVTPQGAITDVLPACRCYRCGDLLTADTVTVDRVFPGCEGGTYRTPLKDQREQVTNIRPACADCNSETGGHLGAERKRATS